MARKAAVIAVAIVMGMGLLSSAPASADPYNGPCSATWTSCTTGSLQAGPSHTIRIEALTFVGGGNFKLIDVSGAVVWQKGLGNFQHKWYSVTGLYSSYYCTVRDASPGAGCALFTS